ncbi:MULTISPECIES: hypothetical protein [unclassified Mesorhizobium]|uniref:hypothetical protein n=1 Tax=unclassified Mesorhizobium TaxID=325217 RepID=UPI000FCAE7BB|nr:MULTISPECIES: hypothetical protein [unclassified Mesorhizobium]RUW70903.1 hypothetical protein EOA31_19150 [Mesorhizobium sp. M4B.F.Ca.ET.049.02.1.2]TGV25025.1 hypothetical protein EN786_16430 [Mesorhizobium sp. M4B.F.Ca.ET.143.01.1.1]
MLSEWLKSLSGHYPQATRFSPGLKLTHEDSRRFASLWLSEGVPFAFLAVPAVFQIARENLAKRLTISFRDISMTGSGRIGYSMSPSKFGTAYSADSDVDLFIISERWFSELSKQALQFLDDYKAGAVNPSNPTQREFWDDHLVRLPRNIDQGFLDARKIPTTRSPAAKSLETAAWHFRRDVNLLSDAETVKRASIRVYQNWDSAVGQIAFNVRKALEYWKPVEIQGEAPV